MPTFDLAHMLTTQPRAETVMVDGLQYRKLTEHELHRIASDAVSYQMAQPLTARSLPGSMCVNYADGMVREEVNMHQFERTYAPVSGTHNEYTLKAPDRLYIATEKLYMPTKSGFRTVQEGDAVVFRLQGKRCVSYDIDIIPQSAVRARYEGPVTKAASTISERMASAARGDEQRR